MCCICRKTSSDPSQQQQVYKTMYSETLKVTQRSNVMATESGDDESNSVLVICKNLLALMKTLETLCQSIKSN